MADLNHKPEDSVSYKENAAKNKTIKLTLIIPTGAYFLSGLRNLALNIAKEMTGIDDQWSYRWQTVVDELVNNAIEHGSATDKEVTITFISHYLEGIEVFVSDTGTGPHQKTADEMNQYLKESESIAPDTFKSIRGRGLRQIALQWTDQLEFKANESGGLTIHAVLNKK